MKKVILIAVFLLTPLVSLAETLQTNVQGVTVKNFQCANNQLSFNVVNKSNKTLTYLNVNIFDSENDPIEKFWVDLHYLTSNSGQRYTQSTNCSRLIRFGLTVDTN